MAHTLASLRTRVLDLADMTGSSFPVEARVNEYLNSELSELYDLLVTKYEDYYISQSDISITGGTSSYTISDTISDFYKVRKAFYKSGDHRYRLETFRLNELENNVLSGSAHGSGCSIRYNIFGGKLWLSPEPSSSFTIEMWYIPKYSELSDDTDVISFDIMPGWEEYAVIGSAIRLLEREESDATMLHQRKAQLAARINNASLNRNAGEPRFLQRTRRLGRNFGG